MKYFILFFTIFCLSHPAQADDNKRDLAIGMGVGLFMMGIEALSDNAQANQNDAISKEPQQNIANDSVTSKPKLSYDNDVAKLQKSLKILEYYHGAVDGLKGKGTLSALHQWQADQGLDISDSISQTDLLLADQQAEKKNQETARNTELELDNQELIKIYSAFYEMEGVAEYCMDFKNSSHHLARIIDGDLEKNFINTRKRFLQEMKKKFECKNISDANIAVIQSKAKEHYDNSDMGELTALQKKMGAHLYINENDVYSRIEGCNTLSQHYKLLYQKNKDKELTCEYVE